MPANRLRALDQLDFRGLLTKNAITPIGSMPEELGACICPEVRKYAKVVRDAGLRID